MIDVGIISAPRNPYYFGNSLDSFFAQWDIKPHVFYEPECPKHLHMDKVEAHHNKEQLGCVLNWLNAAQWMLENTKSSFVMLCEDDILWMEGAKKSIISNLTVNCGLMSPYCSTYNAPRNKENRKPIRGWAPMHYCLSGLCGALCLIFPRPSLGKLLSDKERFLFHSHGDDSARSRRIFSGPIFLDYAIGHVIKRCENMEILTHNPTLIQHLGVVSTFPQNNNPENIGCAARQAAV